MHVVDGCRSVGEYVTSVMRTFGLVSAGADLGFGEEAAPGEASGGASREQVFLPFFLSFFCDRLAAYETRYIRC
jgi:hypothetical protein